MITSITIRDFQAHRKLKLQLDPHLTTVVGSSDVGKSAIVRALAWVATNKPSGVEFIRHGAEDASVRVVVDDRIVTRGRGKDGNSYAVDGKPLKAFGAEVPEEIKNIFAVDEINFQKQHDSPFWFSETAGEVSRKLNGIINLGVIDSVLSKLHSRRTQATGAQTAAVDGLKVAETACEGLVWVKEADQALRAMEEARDNAIRTHGKAGRLRALVRDGREAQLIQTNAANRLRYGCVVLALAEELLTKRERADLLGGLVTGAVRSEAIVGQATNTIPAAKAIVDDWEGLEKIKQKKYQLAKVVRDVQLRRRQLKFSKSMIVAYQEIFDTAIGGRCPLCEQTVKIRPTK